MRIVDAIKEKQEEGIPFWSFEYFPPKTQLGLENLLLRIDRMASMGPMFIDVTWPAGRERGEQARALSICEHAMRYAGVCPMLHLSLTDMSVAALKEAASQARSRGIRNLLLLRGDPADGKTGDWTPHPEGLATAAELVRLIKAEHGDWFCIGVAGHPEGFEAIGESKRGEEKKSDGTASEGLEEHVRSVVEKVEAGAEFVLTQFFYTPGVYSKFVTSLREAGVPSSIPIIPGILPVISLQSFLDLTSHVNCAVPKDMLDALLRASKSKSSVGEEEDGGSDGGGEGVAVVASTTTEIIPSPPTTSTTSSSTTSSSTTSPSPPSSPASSPSSAVAVAREGLRYVVALCRHLLEAEGAPGLHFFTLNTDAPVREVLHGVGLLRGHERRRFPWRHSADAARAQEAVRPIFWSNRPWSYVRRTRGWDSFPEGKWTGARRAEFGPMTEVHVGGLAAVGTRAERRALWGESLASEEDVANVFVNYVSGTIPRIPWCDQALLAETTVIRDQLQAINKLGFLTINSQPRVNAAPSDHPIFGWGGKGGYVYQKSYIECFCSPALLGHLMTAIQRVNATNETHSTSTTTSSSSTLSSSPHHRVAPLTFMATDAAGNEYTNSKERREQAVTWGVFPGKEVLQPTVVDPESFQAWKDEAFALWSAIWADAYDDAHPAVALLESIRDSWYLVNVVDHDFLHGDIFQVFHIAAQEQSKDTKTEEK